MRVIDAKEINGVWMCRADDIHAAIDYVMREERTIMARSNVNAVKEERFRCSQLLQDAAGSVLIGSVVEETRHDWYTPLDVAEILLRIAADVTKEKVVD
jgi:hypothetical protein